MSRPDMFVKIPKERVGILIGPEGKVKQYIEEKLNVKLDIDGEGSVTITLCENAADPSMLLRAKDVVTAIGRGFPPENAYRLIRNEDEIEELTEADVVVYGHTVGIIGSFSESDAARNAVQMIIDGCEHHTMYNYLQKKRTELKKEKLQLWEKPKGEK